MELTNDIAFKKAIEAHQAGQIEDAERLYRAILQAQPQHPDASHNLGIIAISLNKPDLALPLFKTALEANANQGQYWISYIDALIKTNQVASAKSMLEQGKKRGLKGDKVEALEAHLATLHGSISEEEEKLNNRLNGAVALREAGKYQEAQEWLNNFLSQDSSDAEAWSLLTQILIMDNKIGEADKALSRAIAIKPNLPSIYRNQARLLLKQSKPVEALERAKLAYDQSSRDLESWLVLAVCLGANQNDMEALSLIERALLAKPNYAEAYAIRVLIRLRANDSVGAAADLEVAVNLKPHLTQLWALLGSLRYQSKNLSGAIEALTKAHELNPTNVNYIVDLGELLRQDNNILSAISLLEDATKLEPKNVNAWTNLGAALQQNGQLKDAKHAYEQSLAINPKSAAALSNLGLIAKDFEDFESALKYFEQAISIDRNLADVYYNLSITLEKIGRLGDALAAVMESIKIEPTIQSKNSFVFLCKKTNIQVWDKSLAQFIITALQEPWGRPSNLIGFACRLLKTNTEFTQLLNQFKEGVRQTDSDQNLISSIAKKEFVSNSLLCAMLTSSPIPDPQIERFLTALRRNLLENAASNIGHENTLSDNGALYCSLAQQCFINEYVYYQTPQEINDSNQILNQLTQALKEKQNIPDALVIVVACYFPLYSIEGAEKLLHQDWPDDVKMVLKQQLQEPLDELNVRASIRSHTSIDNPVSLAVQSQYEENPYPRWVSLPIDSSKKCLNAQTKSKFPLSAFRRLENDANPEILIAGCGTGQHPIGTSQLIQGANILAVDLSMASLAYAKRKTAELGITNIEYAQADLLKLGSLGRSFDVIESSGVLHHLENPFLGWEILLSLLRPNGLMKLGFYSELARQDIVRVRKLISAANIVASPQGIRDYRKYLLDLNVAEDYGFATSSSDFFSTSACRDLLFHVQEHRMTLPVLAKFLKEHNLTFLGFDIDSSVKHAYKNRFPDDPSATKLDNWHTFEEENPNTFVGMYQFWCQKQS